MKVYQNIATKLNAMENCKKHGNLKWLEIHGERLEGLVEKYLPKGGDFVQPIFCSLVTPELIGLKTWYRFAEGSTVDLYPIEFIITPSLLSNITLSLNYMETNIGHKEDTYHDLWLDALTQEIEEIV